MELKEPLGARIGVDSVEERLTMYVANLDELCLLGLDYLTQSEACINFGWKLVRVHGHEVPLLLLLEWGRSQVTVLVAKFSNVA